MSEHTQKPINMSKVKKKLTVFCELCLEQVSEGKDCERKKNGYCGVFRLQAALDAVEFKMHKPNK